MGPALHYFVKTDPEPLMICHIRSQHLLAARDRNVQRDNYLLVISYIGGMYIHRQLADSSSLVCYTLRISLPSPFVVRRRQTLAGKVRTVAAPI